MNPSAVAISPDRAAAIASAKASLRLLHDMRAAGVHPLPVGKYPRRKPMTEPVFFVVERAHGTEIGTIIHDRLPTKFTGKQAAGNGLVYSVDLRKLPDTAWQSAGLSELFATWLSLGRIPETRPVEPVAAERKVPRR